MKKVLAAVLSLTVLLAFASCDPDQGGTSSTASGSGAGTSSSAGGTSTTPVISVEIPSEVEEEVANLALRDDATYIDMNTGKASDDEGYMEYYAGMENPGNAFDGNAGSAWQLKDKTDDGVKMSYEDGQAWIGVSFEEAVAADVIVLKWETGSVTAPFADGGYKIEYTTDGETWQVIEGAEVVRDDTAIAETSVDTITFETIEATGFRAVILNGTSTKYAPKLWEFELYAPEEAEGDTASDVDTSETVAE